MWEPERNMGFPTFANKNVLNYNVVSNFTNTGIVLFDIIGNLPHGSNKVKEQIKWES